MRDTHTQGGLKDIEANDAAWEAARGAAVGAARVSIGFENCILPC